MDFQQLQEQLIVIDLIDSNREDQAYGRSTRGEPRSKEQHQ